MVTEPDPEQVAKLRLPIVTWGELSEEAKRRAYRDAIRFGGIEGISYEDFDHIDGPGFDWYADGLMYVSTDAPPWEVSREQFARAWRASGHADVGSLYLSHYKQVEEAIEKGKDIYPHAVADHPELKLRAIEKNLVVTMQDGISDRALYLFGKAESGEEMTDAELAELDIRMQAEGFDDQATQELRNIYDSQRLRRRNTQDIEERGGGVLRAEDGSLQIVHPSAKNPGLYQVSRFSESGITGDSQFDSIEEAVRFAHGTGHTELVSGAEADRALIQSIEAESSRGAQFDRITPGLGTAERATFDTKQKRLKEEIEKAMAMERRAQSQHRKAGINDLIRKLEKDAGYIKDKYGKRLTDLAQIAKYEDAIEYATSPAHRQALIAKLAEVTRKEGYKDINARAQVDVTNTMIVEAQELGLSGKSAEEVGGDVANMMLNSPLSDFYGAKYKDFLVSQVEKRKGIEKAKNELQAARDKARQGIAELPHLTDDDKNRLQEQLEGTRHQRDIDRVMDMAHGESREAAPVVMGKPIDEATYRLIWKQPRAMAEFLAKVTPEKGFEGAFRETKQGAAMWDIRDRLRKLGWMEDAGADPTPEGRRVIQYLDDLQQGFTMESYVPAKGTIVPAPPTGWYTSKLSDGRDVYSEGHFLLIGKPPAKHKIAPEPPELKRYFEVGDEAISSAAPVEPVGYAGNLTEGTQIVFDNGMQISSDYYDFIKSQFGDAEFRATAKDKAALIFSKGAMVGTVMPYRGDTPKALREFIGKPKTPAQETQPHSTMPTSTMHEELSRPQTPRKSTIESRIVLNGPPKYDGKIKALVIDGAPDFAVIDWRKPQYVGAAPGNEVAKHADKDFPFGLTHIHSGLACADLDTYEACGDLARNLQDSGINWNISNHAELRAQAGDEKVSEFSRICKDARRCAADRVDKKREETRRQGVAEESSVSPPAPTAAARIIGGSEAQSVSIEQSEKGLAREMEHSANPLPASADALEEITTASNKADSQIAATGPEVAGTSAPNVLLDDIPFDLAMRAHSGTNWSPNQRAQGERQSYVSHMETVWGNLQKRAITDEQRSRAAGVFEQYRQDWLSRYKALLSSRSGLVSAFIAGPSKFPSARMNKKDDAYQKKISEFLEWDAREQRAMKQAVRPDLPRSISADRADAVEELQKKIDKAEKMQNLMKGANAIVRKKGLTADQKVEQMITLGLPEKAARQLLEPDYAGHLGFPDFELKNNNANIRRMKVRIAEITANRARKPGSATFEGGYVEENERNNRIQIFFDKKPSEEMLEKLSANGFHWAPSEDAWQRQRTENARSAVERLLGVKLVSEPDVPPAEKTVEFKPPEEENTNAPGADDLPPRRRLNTHVMTTVTSGRSTELYSSIESAFRSFQHRNNSTEEALMALNKIAHIEDSDPYGRTPWKVLLGKINAIAGEVIASLGEAPFLSDENPAKALKDIISIGTVIEKEGMRFSDRNRVEAAIRIASKAIGQTDSQTFGMGIGIDVREMMPVKDRSTVNQQMTW